MNRIKKIKRWYLNGFYTTSKINVDVSYRSNFRAVLIVYDKLFKFQNFSSTTLQDDSTFSSSKFRIVFILISYNAHFILVWCEIMSALNAYVNIYYNSAFTINKWRAKNYILQIAPNLPEIPRYDNYCFDLFWIEWIWQLIYGMSNMFIYLMSCSSLDSFISN